MRINGQLIDAVTGVHVWVERYDRKFDDIFALQDEIALSVVASPLDKSMREMTSGCASARPTAFPEVTSILATLVA